MSNSTICLTGLTGVVEQLKERMVVGDVCLIRDGFLHIAGWRGIPAETSAEYLTASENPSAYYADHPDQFARNTTPGWFQPSVYERYTGILI